MRARAVGIAVCAMVLACALALVFSRANAADAAEGDTMQPPRLAVIDMQKIIRESKAVQSIQRQIEEQRSQYQEKLSEKEKELRAADENLTRQRTVLSSEAFKKKRRELEERVNRLQRGIQESKRKLDKNYSQAIAQVQQKLVEIVRDIANDRDLDMVLGKATVVIVRPELDITEQALKRLNSELKSVDVAPLDG